MQTSIIVCSELEILPNNKKKSNSKLRGGFGSLFFICSFINIHMLIIKRKELVLVGIIYYLPDHKSLINEFYCQFEDIVPEIPRVHEFLNYWKTNIEAPIKEVNVSLSHKTRYATFYGEIIKC